MNLDKTIQELTNRLDEVYPYYSYSSISNNQNKNDGINYWKGKKIISTKAWNDLYQKSSTYTDTYTITLMSRKPLQYFPNDYNGSISAQGIVEEKLKEEIQNWNADYYELLEYRKNPTWGRMKCTKCLLSSSNDDPIFVGIEKVFARIVSNQYNNNNSTPSHSLSTNHCNIMNIYSCPFDSKQEYYNERDEKQIGSKYPYKREDLFTLHQISFAIEQAITTFFEITKQNEIIFEVDFENGVQEIHTKYNGESESWGWNVNVKEQSSKVKPISKIVIRDEHDIYDILTNREKLECLLQEYENNQLDKEQKAEEQLQVCCDENTPYVPKEDEDNNLNNKKIVSLTLIANKTESLTAGKKQQKLQQQQLQEQQNYSHRGENSHSKNTEEQTNESEKEINNKHLKRNLKVEIKDDLEKQEKEQQILLKENKQNIINFLLDNKESIRVEDLKMYEPVYKCYREKGNCHICNSLSNIICNNCSNYNNEFWLCTNHWKQHSIEDHE